jgi:hypothetical protein
MITVLKPHLSPLIILFFHLATLFVQFSSLPSKDIAYFLCDNHQRLEGLLNGARYSPQETSREEIWLVVGCVLEQFLPDLVGSHVKTQTNCAQ